MIELLLQAERALGMGLVDQAEYLYRQASQADPRNSIAVVGLGRVALERDDEVEAWRQAKRALEIDPENAAANRMIERLEDVWRRSGRETPTTAANRDGHETAAEGTQPGSPVSESEPRGEATMRVPAPTFVPAPATPGADRSAPVDVGPAPVDTPIAGAQAPAALDAAAAGDATVVDAPGAEDGPRDDASASDDARSGPDIGGVVPERETAAAEVGAPAQEIERPPAPVETPAIEVAPSAPDVEHDVPAGVLEVAPSEPEVQPSEPEVQPSEPEVLAADPPVEPPAPGGSETEGTTAQEPAAPLEASTVAAVRAWEASVAGVVEPEVALEELVARPVDTHGWPASDLAEVPLVTPPEPSAIEQDHEAERTPEPDVEREPTDVPNAATPDDESTRPDPTIGAGTQEWPVREQGGTHLGPLPGLDRMKHLFGRRRE